MDGAGNSQRKAEGPLGVPPPSSSLSRDIRGPVFGHCETRNDHLGHRCFRGSRTARSSVIAQVTVLEWWNGSVETHGSVSFGTGQNHGSISSFSDESGAGVATFNIRRRAGQHFRKMCRDRLDIRGHSIYGTERRGILHNPRAGGDTASSRDQADGKEPQHMAKHRPAHARSGFGRYTPPRRLNPAHAAPGSGRHAGRVAGIVIGGGALATAGLMGLAAAPAGAACTFGVAHCTIPADTFPGPNSFHTVSPENNHVTVFGNGGNNGTITAHAGNGSTGSHGNFATAKAYDNPFSVGGSSADAWTLAKRRTRVTTTRRRLPPGRTSPERSSTCRARGCRRRGSPR